MELQLNRLSNGHRQCLPRGYEGEENTCAKQWLGLGEAEAGAWAGEGGCWLLRLTQVFGGICGMNEGRNEWEPPLLLPPCSVFHFNTHRHRTLQEVHYLPALVTFYYSGNSVREGKDFHPF